LFKKKKKPKVQKAKKKRAVGEKPVFKSYQDVEEYYKSEKAKISSFVEEMEREKARAYLDVAQNKLIALRAKRKKLEVLHQDLNNHLEALNKSIEEFKAKKSAEEETREQIKKLKDAFYSLEDEAKKIMETKGTLLQKEKELIEEMKKLAGSAEKTFKVTDLENSKKLMELESSKEHVIMEAMHLLGEEAKRMFADKEVLNKIDEEAKEKIRELNKELEKLNRARRKILERRQLLKVSEEEAEEELKNLQAEVEALEARYKKLLGGK
jgi:chromosome segregation ATPase